MRLINGYYSLIFLGIVLLSCESKPVKNSTNLDIHFEDIDNFWKAYDIIKPITDHSVRTAVIQDEYMNKGSKALQSLIKKDKLTASDYATYLKDTVFFNSIRETTFQIKNDTTKIRHHLRAFESTYPLATFSDIYFVMGQFKRAGTVIDSSMIIELEKNARSQQTRSAFLFNDKQLNNLNDQNSLMSLIVHEQVHVNQTNINTRNLLSKAICEGSADFLMYLHTGEHPAATQRTYTYGDANETTLWVKFKTDLDINYKYIKTDWFYNYDREDIPPDLGYYMGFKICEKFYNESDDKLAAIAFMLDGNNSKKVLELSGYNGGL
ncbi:gliding motility protein GldB-related protein [Psychroserpens sp. BH13MA-6]